jgi:hypothetical protein
VVKGGVPGGLPSQLSKLTCLQVTFRLVVGLDTAGQLQHLSCLTALQQLAVSCFKLPAKGTAGIQNLSHLSSLETSSLDWEFSVANTSRWTSLTALESLSLVSGKLQPQALAAFTKLRKLSLKKWGIIPEGAPLEEVLVAVSQLPLLTELCFIRQRAHPVEPPATAASLTALTASTNLCSLTLDLALVMTAKGPHHVVLFKPGSTYPHLRLIDLCIDKFGPRMPLHEQQLQALCSSCTALENLKVSLREDASPTAWLPLLQLPALTQLRLRVYGADAAASAVGVAAQLIGLRQLVVQPEQGPQWRLTEPTLLQLTALTVLEHLQMLSGVPRPIMLNKVSVCGTRLECFCAVFAQLLWPESLSCLAGGGACKPDSVAKDEGGQQTLLCAYTGHNSAVGPTNRGPTDITSHGAT